MEILTAAAKPKGLYIIGQIKREHLKEGVRGEH